MKYFIFLALLTHSVIAAASDSSTCSQDSEECVAVGQWHISAAIGGGVLTNPLHSADNIPLILIPYISYYNERFFLDNTTLGYTLQESHHFDFSIILELNSEQKYFNRSHAGNLIGVDAIYSESSDPISAPITDVDNPSSPNEDNSDSILPDTSKSQEPRQLFDLDDISKRDWALDAGLLAHWYIGERHKFSAQWAHDISDVYKGQHVRVSYKYAQSVFDWPARFQLTTGLHWQSTKLIDYYYGLNEEDNVQQAFYYNGEQGITPFLGAAFNYRINKQWQFKFSAKRRFLSDSIVNSPIVQDRNQDYLFIGGLYEF